MGNNKFQGSSREPIGILLRFAALQRQHSSLVVQQRGRGGQGECAVEPCAFEGLGQELIIDLGGLGLRDSWH